MAKPKEPKISVTSSMRIPLKGKGSYLQVNFRDEKTDYIFLNYGSIYQSDNKIYINLSSKNKKDLLKGIKIIEEFIEEAKIAIEEYT